MVGGQVVVLAAVCRWSRQGQLWAVPERRRVGRCPRGDVVIGVLLLVWPASGVAGPLCSFAVTIAIVLIVQAFRPRPRPTVS